MPAPFLPLGLQLAHLGVLTAHARTLLLGEETGKTASWLPTEETVGEPGGLKKPSIRVEKHTSEETAQKWMQAQQDILDELVEHRLQGIITRPVDKTHAVGRRY